MSLCEFNSPEAPSFLQYFYLLFISIYTFQSFKYSYSYTIISS
ncbi:hypothetical protein QOS_2600, partial [Clostridioides difficile Y184]